MQQTEGQTNGHHMIAQAAISVASCVNKSMCNTVRRCLRFTGMQRTKEDQMINVAII